MISQEIAVSYKLSLVHASIRLPYWERAHQLDFLKIQKEKSPTNRRTSEEPETSAQKGLARQIQFCRVYFCLGIIWEVVLKQRTNMDHTKIYLADLDSPYQELFVCDLKFVAALLVCWEIVFTCAFTGGAINLYTKRQHRSTLTASNRAVLPPNFACIGFEPTATHRYLASDTISSNPGLSWYKYCDFPKHFWMKGITKNKNLINLRLVGNTSVMIGRSHEETIQALLVCDSSDVNQYLRHNAKNGICHTRIRISLLIHKMHCRTQAW